MEAEKIAQWVIDNRYPKSEKEKVSDSEMYHEIIAMISGRTQMSDTETFTPDEIRWVKLRSFYTDNRIVSDCIRRVNQKFEKSTRIAHIMDDISNLYKGYGHSDYSREIQQCNYDNDNIKMDIRVYGKLNYWLSKQDQNAKIQDVFNF